MVVADTINHQQDNLVSLVFTIFPINFVAIITGIVVRIWNRDKLSF